MSGGDLHRGAERGSLLNPKLDRPEIVYTWLRSGPPRFALGREILGVCARPGSFVDSAACPGAETGAGRCPRAASACSSQ